MSARAASTILLVRDGEAGLEVFLVQRHRRSGFLPNAWVFPGGQVDPADGQVSRVRGGAAVLKQLGLPEDEARAYLVAGVRETFEEAGIWLGTGTLPQSARAPLAAGQVSLDALLETHGAALELDRLAGWSWWVTPVVEPRRYDTRFLVAHVTERSGHHDDHETFASGWFRPGDLIGRTLGAFPLAPPTWWTLCELADCSSSSDVLARAGLRSMSPIQPIMRFSDEGMVLLLPGHSDHPAPPVSGLPAQIDFEEGCWTSRF